MADTRELMLVIKAKLDDLERGMKKAGSDIDFVNKKTGSLSNSFVTLKKLAISAFAGWGLVRIGKEFISAASTAESFQVRLKTLLRSGDEANRMFNNMREFASKVPYEFRSVMESAIMLSGVMKGGVDEVTRWMPMIADLAAAHGLSIEETTLNIMKMYSAGINAAELFRDRGVRAALGFADNVKYSTKESVDHFIHEWEKADSYFRGGTKALAETWVGKTSMMKDAWFNFRVEFMESGMLEYAKKIQDVILLTAAGIMRFMAEDKIEKIHNLNEEIKITIENLEKLKNPSFLNKLFHQDMSREIEGETKRLDELIKERDKLLISIEDHVPVVEKAEVKKTNIVRVNVGERIKLTEKETAKRIEEYNKLTQKGIEAEEKYLKELEEDVEKGIEISIDSVHRIEQEEAESFARRESEHQGFFDGIWDYLRQNEKRWADSWDRIGDVGWQEMQEFEQGLKGTFYEALRGRGGIEDVWSETLGRMRDLFLWWIADTMAAAAMSNIIKPLLENIAASFLGTSIAESLGYGAAGGAAGATAGGYMGIPGGKPTALGTGAVAGAGGVGIADLAGSYLGTGAASATGAIGSLGVGSLGALGIGGAIAAGASWLTSIYSNEAKNKAAWLSMIGEYRPTGDSSLLDWGASVSAIDPTIQSQASARLQSGINDALAYWGSVYSGLSPEQKTKFEALLASNLIAPSGDFRQIWGTAGLNIREYTAPENWKGAVDLEIGKLALALASVFKEIGLQDINPAQEYYTKYPQAMPMLAQEGGIFSGPESGYPVTLHGTEAVLNEDQMSGLGNVIFINKGIVTTNDIDSWFADRLSRIRRFGVGERVQTIDKSTVGINI